MKLTANDAAATRGSQPAIGLASGDRGEPQTLPYSPHDPTLSPLPRQDSDQLLAAILARLDRIEATLNLSASRPPYRTAHLTAKEAAGYLRISYSTFRKKATKIRRQPGTGRYRIEDLDEFAASLRSKRKR